MLFVLVLIDYFRGKLDVKDGADPETILLGAFFCDFVTGCFAAAFALGLVEHG